MSVCDPVFYRIFNYAYHNGHIFIHVNDSFIPTCFSASGETENHNFNQTSKERSELCFL